METTQATAGMGLGVGARKSPRVRAAVASAAIAVTLASSFALGRFSAPAAEPVIHGAPAVGTLPAQSHRVAPAAISSVYGNNVPPSPLRPHQPHHRVKFGG